MSMDGDASADGVAQSWEGVADWEVPVTKISPVGSVRRDGLFIKGPIPVGQMSAAIVAGHVKAPLMLLAIKFRVDVEQTKWVKQPTPLLSEWRFTASDRSRSIAALEKAGLIEVRRRDGRPPLVRLVPWKVRDNG
jgi:DNA-binding transcriptional ArsR family regulator